MFNFKGLIQSVGIVLLITILFSFFIGFFNIGSIPIIILVQFFITNALIGLLAPFKNIQTPYTAAFLGSITLTVINYVVAYFIFNIYVLANPAQISNNLLLSTSVALITALFSKEFIIGKLRKDYV
ncbi:hypothetical protein WAK64_10350 [Bacillus spongiae]|uniref:Phage holin family protein n=1 Tax=Bacillus spongiae TaxID=2683610 RepID=A0ABU8HDT5_9BACI